MLTTPCRVRFAPSPTGKLHLGSLRTSLFNFLFARKNKGQFVLRIEDTDQKRFVPGCAAEFETTLSHYNLALDESPLLGGPFWPYIQSQRNHLYKFYVDMLIDSGHAYNCFCSEQRLDILRRNAVREKSNSRYDGRCRSLSREEVTARLANNEPSVVRFKFETGKAYFTDTVFGNNVHEVDEGDFIIIKSDGLPTYHFANVVDDHSMQITHVIRGAEWLPSVPKHVRIYEAFNWKQPTWMHLPLITRDGNKKLSKRDADAFVQFYDSYEGYLPLSILNFLLRNGSGIRNFDSNHLYSLDEMIENFDENLITRKDFMMDQARLESYGQLAFKEADFEKFLYPEISKRLKQYFTEQNISIDDESVFDVQYIRRVINFLRMNEESFCRLRELISGNFQFFFYWPKNLIVSKILAKIPRDAALYWLKIVVGLKYPDGLNNQNLRQLVVDNQNSENLLSFRKFTTLVRIALTGDGSGPPIGELVEFFSANEFHKRLLQTIQLLEENVVSSKSTK